MNDFKIIHLDEINSTNTYASALLSGNNDICNTVVTAKFQNNGKGQGENKWSGEYGKNLLCSIIICPDFVHAFDQFRISKIASLAIKESLDYLGINSVIKWPNDILTGNKKIAGILIENTICKDFLTTSIIGIGLNVNQEVFEDMPVKPGSVLLETSKHHDIQEILELLLEKFDYWYLRLANGETDEIDREYLKNLYGLNTFLPFRKGNLLFEAMITGVGESGELFLRRQDGKILKVIFKEIEYL